jgi:hypothetical protein
MERPGCEVNHSPPLSARVKNEWSLASAPPIYLRGVGKDNFTIFRWTIPIVYSIAGDKSVGQTQLEYYLFVKVTLFVVK